jgi:hypothetical protein
MGVNLETTNWLLGVIALSSAVQMLALIGAGIFGFKVYRQMTETIATMQQKVAEVEAQHIAPLRTQVDAILGDVHRFTARVTDRTEKVDEAISDTMGRVDHTTERVKYSVREKVSRATGVVRGIRAVIASLLSTDGPGGTESAAGSRL